MQVFKEYPLYRYTGEGTPDKPEGFARNPSLVDYLNHLARQGKVIFQVVALTDNMWYTIITVEEVEC